ncbi:MAG: uracil-DNA glycosylase family protein [Muribaculaceae bacterium]|nr:uracil-DNA glycosylase family protein [Muribaculaceae bacterium]
MDNQNIQPIEQHPWEPFIPEGARILIMGTFPPGAHRWSMDFYYPNPTNDFWKIMGLIFLGNPDALRDSSGRKYDVDAVKTLMTEKHIALNDTARRVRRLKGNASDKFLEIIEPVPLFELLAVMPDCHAVATTGEKAAGVIAELTSTPLPRMGEMITDENGLMIFRMPSTSRAYPLALQKKADYYADMFRKVGIL